MRDSGSPGLSPGRAAIRRALGGFAALSLLATACVALARAWWWFELFSHFRVQLMVLQLALLVAFLLGRRPRWALILTIACLINGAPILEYLLPLEPSVTGLTGAADRTVETAAATAQPGIRGDSAALLRVASANVLTTNSDAAGLIEILRSADPDVFAIVELTETYMESLESFAAAWPHRELLPRGGAFGIGVYSRRPLADVAVLDLGGVAAIDARITDSGGDWRFVAAHLLPPMSSAMAAQRNAQLSALAAHLRTIDAPHVVVGDLNLSSYSPFFADFLRQTGLSSASAGRGPTLTWPSFFPLLGIPIDHVLVSDDFAVTGYRRAGNIGSDHYPIIVDMIRRQLPLD